MTADMCTSPPEKVILVGGFHETIDLCEKCNKEVIGIIDNRLTGNYYGCDVIGTDDDAADLAKRLGTIAVVLTPDEPSVRKRLHALYAGLGYKLCALIDPSATVSGSAQIGAGVVIEQAAIVSSAAVLGDCVKINMGANITHDVTVGNYSTVAPSAVILGRVTIGVGCYIGANATILPGLTIGNEAVVGAGAVVTRDVGEGRVVKGNPGRTSV